jgi:HlyD family secretion protein
MTRAVAGVVGLLVFAVAGSGCRQQATSTVPRASGYVEATETRIAAKVPGRVATVTAVEGARVEAGQTLVTLSTTDIDLTLRQVRAERDQAEAQRRLLLAGSRVEDVQQAEAQVAVATSERKAAEAELAAARTDEARFEQLVRSRAGSEKQRDDAVARRERAEAQLKAADDRAKATTATLQRVKAGARPEELQAAAARVAVIDARIAQLDHDRGEATIVAPTPGIISSRLVEPGELVSAGTPVAILVDLDRAWASAYVENALVPTLKLDQPATVITDTGERLAGRISFISSKEEFTPRNVQTATERAKLVYRVKVAVDNRQGVLKVGMPVEVEFGAGTAR